jgi:alpha-amylase
MTRRCNAVGVRIYVDLLLNHMGASTGVGTGGTVHNLPRNFPAVPYVDADFNPSCNIDWGSAWSIRNCELVGLPDLNTTRPNVRQNLIDYMNHLIDLGVGNNILDVYYLVFTVYKIY